MNHLSSRTFSGSILTPAQCEEFFPSHTQPRKKTDSKSQSPCFRSGSGFSLPPDMELSLPSSPRFSIHSRSYSVIPHTGRTVNRRRTSESPHRAALCPNRETLSKCGASNLVTPKGKRGDVNSANESEVETRTIESPDEREASEREPLHSVWTIECEWTSNVQRVFSLYQGENCVLTPLSRPAAQNPWGSIRCLILASRNEKESQHNS